MSRLALLLALLALLPAMGCAELRPLLGTPTHALPRTGSPETLRAAVNRAAARRTAQVSLADGRTVAARALHLAPDSARWHDPDSGRLHAVAASEVERVVVPRTRIGVAEGIVGGVIAGVLVGAALASRTPSQYPDEAGLGAMTGTVLGPVVGAVVAITSGGEATFVFEPAGP